MSGEGAGTGKTLDVCRKCRKGGEGHTGHLTTADNCVLYRVTNPSRAEYLEVLRDHELSLARDDFATRALFNKNETGQS